MDDEVPHVLQVRHASIGALGVLLPWDDFGVPGGHRHPVINAGGVPALKVAENDLQRHPSHDDPKRFEHL